MNIDTIVAWIKTVGCTYIMWIGIHYASSHLYVHFCVPKNLTGFLFSPLLTSSTYCSALRWSINTGADEIQTMWMLMGTFLSYHLLYHRTRHHTESSSKSQHDDSEFNNEDKDEDKDEEN